MGDIYLLESPSGKKYVGQAVKRLVNGKKWGYDQRWKQHIREARDNRNYSIYLDNSIRKYGSHNFKVSLLFECNSIDEMNEKEQYYINELNTMIPNGYNLTSGGYNCRQSEQTREKKRISMLGKNVGKTFNICRKRANKEDENLPKYIQRTKKGYRISSHPSKISKAFCSKKISMEEKLKLSLEFLNKLNEEYFKNKEKSSSTKQYSDEVSSETKS
jgi:group I intron endonuclease